MQRILINSFVFTVGLFLLGVGPATAQRPAGQSPSTQQEPSAQRPSNPDMNNPASQTPENQPMTSKVDDKKFVKEAAAGGLAEVEMGKLAVQKSSDDAVKQFGQKMIDDHTKANEQLKEIASKQGITIPESLDSKQQSKVDKLSKLSGPAFDKAYVKDAVKDHEKDVREFKNEAQNGSDPNIKQFASSTLPTLEQHLDMAKTLRKTAKQTSGGK